MPHYFEKLAGRANGRVVFLEVLPERSLTLQRLATALALLAVLTLAASCTTPPQPHLAVAHGNQLTIVNPDTAQALLDITRYQEVTRLAYRPDGTRLAVGVCFGNRVVELEPPGYAEVATPITAAGCPWAIAYAPDNQALAAAIPWRPSPTDALFGHLWINGPRPLDRDLGRPLNAFAYRPGGGEIAVATPQGLTVLSTTAAYPVLGTVAGLQALSLGYTTDGARLLVGTANGLQVLNAAAGYGSLSQVTGAPVIDIAVAPSGGWVALVQGPTLSVRRAPDLVEVSPPQPLTSATGFRDADFSSDGSLLAVAEQTGQVRRFRVGSWQELLPPIAVSGRVDAIAFRPNGFGQRLPVLFVHGHTGNSGEAWFQPAPAPAIGTTSFAAALAANPQLPVDAFYLELPVHGSGQNESRSITEDAQDILAMIEGGLDTQGRTQVGLLNLPAYQAAGRVAIIAYSQGTLSSRYYVKNLMGSRRNGALTVSEFVTLAAPNHGVGDAVSCGTRLNPNEPDRARRQLCAGQVAVAIFQNCGQCPPQTPVPFTNNQSGDATFITDLNGHPLADSCAAGPHATEAPFSRPARADGILYVNLYGVGDELVGDGTQSGDCAGRRLARNLALNADNREFPGLPSFIHTNVPHHWEVICTSLSTVANHQAPAAGSPCTGLTHP